MPRALPTLSRAQVVRLWFHRQGLAKPQGSNRLTAESLRHHLETTGALQLDTINVVDRAHFLTLWTRFGPYDRAALDRWTYDDQVAYEYWGHEASLLPISHLPIGRRRMRRFPPKSWEGKSWWKHYKTSAASKRRVLKRLEADGPLESIDFDPSPNDGEAAGVMPLAREDKRSLKLLWHAGRVAIRKRRHFRCVYDLAERVLPAGAAATVAEFENSWLLTGLSGNGIATEGHLSNYITGPSPKQAVRKRVIARKLKTGRIVEVRVADSRSRWFALPEHLAGINELPPPRGTTLVCPFDSLLWQRKRAEELLDFHYRIEIYVPAPKRKFGYYVLPILHHGRLVGRLDPKVHRDRAELEVRALYLEDGFKPTKRFGRELSQALDSLREFVGAERIELPKGWTHLG
ncbi:MAG: winged helix-turn-helix domain-containing protein [Gemmatimonadota bacterium]|nr:MAG: winged helix-turn-helix domain-containing protein [Gemmatimonadota bacterium]